MSNPERIQEQEAEVERGREAFAAIYQIVGRLVFCFEDDEAKDCEKLLDNLYALSAGEPCPHDWSVPWPQGRIKYVPDGDGDLC